MISEDDYEKICNIITRNLETRWISANYQVRCLTTGGITRVKEEIKAMVEDDKNAKSLHHR